MLHGQDVLERLKFYIKRTRAVGKPSKFTSFFLVVMDTNLYVVASGRAYSIKKTQIKHAALPLWPSLVIKGAARAFFFFFFKLTGK